MNSKRWIRIWAFIVLMVIPLGVFNYIIDPMGYNQKYSFKLNKYKARLDERKEKFNLIKEGNYDTYIFGSSRCRVVDPDRVKKYINTNAINSAFSSGTISEIKKYVDWIVANRDVKNILIGVDLFGFSEKFNSNGLMPNELSQSEVKLKEYLSYSMLGYSLKTVAYNLKGKYKKQNPEYKAKGVYYVYDYFNLKNKEEFDRFIEEKVKNKPASWHANEFSLEKIKVLTEIIKTAKQNGIELKLFVNPITHQQIFKGENFLTQIELLKELIKQNPEIEIIDFNNFNRVNFENNYFLDYFHYNYDVANCIVDKIYSSKSECGDDFGQIVNNNNIKSYSGEIKEKYNSLKLKRQAPL